MPEMMRTDKKVLYVGIAACFFFVGLILIVFLFWLAFPVIIGLGLWFFAWMFLNLAIKGRTYTDWNAEKIAQKELEKKRKANN
jgi:fatty acid desaturase